MSFAEAKEIALLRITIRDCFSAGDRHSARTALARFAQLAANDNELVAESRRWAIKLG